MMDKSTGITNTPMWRGKVVRDTSPIPSAAKIDTTGSVIEARIDELFKVTPTKGGISKEMVNILKTEIIKIVDDVVAAVVKELVPVMNKTLRENST